VKSKIALASLFAGLALLGARPAWADQPVVQIDWSTTAPLSGHVEDGAVVVRAGDRGGVFPLTAVEGPAISGEGYAVVGEVRYSGVAGRAFLEMWTVFPDGSRYFSRTLDDEGPLAGMTGESDWRPFELPFYLQGSTPPERLEINAVLPSAGEIRIGPLQVVPVGPVSGTGWWSDRAGGLIGGIAGSLLGVLGGTLGLLVSRRRARGLVVGTTIAFGVLGAGLVLTGAVAVAVSQPYAVWYPLLLMGGLLMVMSFVLRAVARRAYTDAELRRMRAMNEI
jgi:hypothetical protein